MNLIDSLAEEYHVLSRNSKAFIHVKNAHLVHYREDILKLKNSKVEFNGRQIILPKVKPPVISYNKVLSRRKSNRDFSNIKLSLKQISSLLSIGYGTHFDADRRKEKKYVPSSGGLNSVELYIIALTTNEVAKGIYHYNSNKHSLTCLSEGDYSIWLKENVFYQDEFSEASMIIILTSSVSKLSKKYGVRSYRLALLDVGHVSQNIYMAAASLNLNVCASAGFIDDELDKALNIDGLETASFLTIMIG